MKQEVSNWVVAWFSSRGKIRCEAQKALEIDYLQAGLLSSLEIVEFVAELEDRFGVQFSEQEMQDPRFSTIGGIAQLVVGGLNRGESDRAESDHTGSEHAGSEQERVDQSTKV